MFLRFEETWGNSLREDIKMTYKKIVYKMLEDDSREWVKQLMKSQFMKSVTDEHIFTSAEVVEMEDDGVDFMYIVKVTVYGDCFGLIGHKDVYVGGTVGDLFGICHSVIWDSLSMTSDNKTLWMECDSTRKLLGITEFNI